VHPATGKPDGVGMALDQDGDIYEGAFRDGVMQPTYRMISKNGSALVQTFYFRQKSKKYEFQFVDDGESHIILNQTCKDFNFSQYFLSDIVDEIDGQYDEDEEITQYYQ